MLPTSIPLAVLVAIGIGIITFIGPCAPTRLAVATDARNDELPTGLLFIAGTTVGFGILGLLGSLLFTMIFAVSPIMYAIIGVVAIVNGLRELWPHDDHQHEPTKGKHFGRLGAFAAGFGSAWTLAPCCTPIVIAAITIAPNALSVGLILAAFGAGHAVPVMGIQRLTALFSSPKWEQSISLALGALSLGFGAYYIALA